LYIFFRGKKYFYDKSNSEGIITITLYLLWNIFSVIRGGFIAENYWDWKGLIHTAMILFLPVVVYTSTNIAVVQSIFRFYVKYAIPPFLIFIFIFVPLAYGYYLAIIPFLLLFFSVLRTRWKIIILLLTLIVLFSLDSRSNVIRFGISFILGFIYYFKGIFFDKLFKIIRFLLMFVPILFFVLAITDTFNVLNMDEYIKGNYEIKERTKNGEVTSSLTGDDRTPLYSEVLVSAQNHNSWWIGRSPARGNDTVSFADDDITGRAERRANEVGVLNVFTWTGIVGLVLYFLIFYAASYLAVNKSNNIFCKITGLFLAFRWIFSWIEEINSFSLNYFVLWILIGLCLSKSFRGMSDEEMKYWIKGIFDERHTVAIS
jgi:hypothetical protein